MADADSQRYTGWNVLAHDVGQADAYSIITPDERIMIDVAKDQIVDTFNTHDSRTIDHLITTHIHDDHVAGLRHLSDEECSIQQTYRPNANRSEVGNETGHVNPIVLEEYFKNLSELGMEFDEIDPVSTGDDILEGGTEEPSLSVLSPPATSDVLHPIDQETGHQREFEPEKANPNGVVSKFEGPNGVSCLFMGDVGDESEHYAESWLLEQHEDRDIDLNTTILFLGHHGSKHGTGTGFLDAVDPEHVVISSSLTNDHTSENPYDGHPHDATLERLHEQEVSVHWTAVHGTIHATVEDSTVLIEHTNGIETTAAADLAALKYHGRANDLNQVQLADIDEIAADDLPDETPEWTNEAAIVTDTSQSIEKTDEQKAKIDTLHTLEVEHRRLTKRKDRLERKREQLMEEKNDLEEEQEREATSGLWGRFTAASGRSTADTESDAETDLDDARSDTDDVDSKSYQHADDIEEAIEMIERENTSLEAAVDSLTRTTGTLQTDIERIEARLAAPSGLTERLSSVVPSFSATETDEQPHVIRQPRFSGATASAAGKTDKRTANGANAAAESAPDPRQDRNEERNRSSDENKDHTTDSSM